MRTPIEYIKESWSIYTQKDNFLYFARIMSVLVILTTLSGYLMVYFFPRNDWYNAGFVFLALLSISINLWSNAVKNIAILKIGESELKVFKLGFKKIGTYLLISLIYSLLILSGLILVIIPGIVFGVWFSFSLFLVLDKNMNIKKSLVMSKLMVKNRFWAVLGRFVVFGLFSLVVSILFAIIPNVGELLISFFAPLFVLPFYLLYKDLSLELSKL